MNQSSEIFLSASYHCSTTATAVVIAAINEKHEMSRNFNDATASAVALLIDPLPSQAAALSAVSQSAEIFLSACYFCSTTATAVVIAAFTKNTK